MRARFWILHAALPLALWAALAALFEATDLDIRAADRAFDFQLKVFPHRVEFLYGKVLHEGGKWLILGLAAVAVLAFFATFRVARLAPWRRAALYVALAIGLSTTVTALLKIATNRYCPWDMTRYNGPVPYTKLFEGTPPPFDHGRGFPAAHTSSALSLFALYFVARDRGARRPWLWLLGVGALGALFAWTQWIRGAHFISHNVWSAGICWTIALALWLALRPVYRRNGIASG